MANLSLVHKLLLVVFILIGGYFASDFFGGSKSAEGLTPVMTSDAKAGVKHELAMLFIGDSYTFVNNLPEMLVDIASSDTENNIRFVVQAYARGGFGLKELWTEQEAIKVIKSRHWDYVVLQEQGTWAMSDASVSTAVEAMNQFDAAIREAGARTVLFTTWPRKPGSAWYTNEKTSYLGNARIMMEQTSQYTKAVAAQLETVAIPVGNFWMNVLEAQPEFPLYYVDGSHPDPAGTYLSALVFYRYFGGHNPTGVSYVPSGVTPDQAAYLRGVAVW